MNIEVKFAEHPVLAAVFVLCCLLSVSCAFAFLMQWNSGELLFRKSERLKQERKQTDSFIAALRWYMSNDWPLWREIWVESKGLRIVMGIAAATGTVGVLIFFYTLY